MDLLQSVVFKASALSSIRVGDVVTIPEDTFYMGGKSYPVTGIDADIISLESGVFLWRQQDGDWLALDPAGGAIMERIGTEQIFVPADAELIDDREMQSVPVDSPRALMEGWQVYIQISDGEAARMENLYHP